MHVDFVWRAFDGDPEKSQIRAVDGKAEATMSAKGTPPLPHFERSGRFAGSVSTFQPARPSRSLRWTSEGAARSLLLQAAGPPFSLFPIKPGISRGNGRTRTAHLIMPRCPEPGLETQGRVPFAARVPWRAQSSCPNRSHGRRSSFANPARRLSGPGPLAARSN